jgi:transposase
MSLKSHFNPEIPVETARVARAAFPQGTALMHLRDELGALFSEEQFADLFPAKGQPAESPAVLAVVLVLQYWEGLSDRQAAEAVRSRIDWKYALGLELTDPGFDFSILSEFRDRLIAGQAEARLLDRVLEAFKARGLLKARGRQRTDSTRVIEAVRDLNRLELVGETLRSVLNTLAKLEPAWLKSVVPAEWHLRYARRFDSLHLPKAQTERHQLAEQIGADGLQLLQHLAAAEALEPHRRLACVCLLRKVWLQQYAMGEQANPVKVRWRPGAELPAAHDLIVSPYDPEARYCVHNQTEWEGYKVHFTETCDDGADLHVLTHVETTPAPEQDVEAPDRIHAALKHRDLLPQEHLMDAGYVSADLLVEAPRDYGVHIVGPITKDVSWQARAQTGFDLSQFVVDWDARQVVCPRGQRSVKWQTGTDLGELDVIRVAFDRATCQACPAQTQCTRSQTQGRSMQLRPRPQHEAIQRTRAAQTTDEFTQRYNMRMGIEGTISQAVRAFDARRSRYSGLAKTHLQMVATAVAINLERFADYLIGLRPVSTKRSAFAALAA